MPPRSRRPGEGQIPIDGLEPRPTLTQILTPEFQLLDPDDFADIPDRFIPYTHPDALRGSLIDVPLSAAEDETAVISYRGPGSQQWLRLTVTAKEFSLFARHIPMLAKTAVNGVFNARDKKLQQETGEGNVIDRSEEAWAAAKRGAMRQVTQRRLAMQQHLDAEIIPRVTVINQFLERTEFENLVRGKDTTVREQFELLRTYVFGDMLEAVGNLRGWNNEKMELARRTLQKRLYMDPDKPRRVTNFKAFLELAREYYGHKHALALSRLAEARRYERNHPDVMADIVSTDVHRAQEANA